jgi:hypothetical protein
MLCHNVIIDHARKLGVIIMIIDRPLLVILPLAQGT